ncbi:hypothetical protein NKG05_00495 [Oerskovia sp. M15]
MSAVAAIDGWSIEQVASPGSGGTLRLTRRGRLVVCVLVAGLVALAALWGGRAFASGPGSRSR